MKRKFVIDTSVYITYAAYNKIHRLVNAIDKYNLEVYVNDEIIEELENNIDDCMQVAGVKSAIILQAIRKATVHKTTVPGFNGSPDPKDNFLFDLAIQTDSEVIVTQEKALLTFKESPVPVHNLKWFKEHYPVPL